MKEKPSRWLAKTESHAPDFYHFPAYKTNLASSDAAGQISASLRSRVALICESGSKGARRDMREKLQRLTTGSTHAD